MQKTADELRALIAIVETAAPVVAWQEAYAPGKWRRVQMLGHLVDSASNNHQRFVRALQVDTLEFPGYEQEGCVRVQEYDSFGAEALLDLWKAYNRLIAHVMERIPEAKRSTPCRIGDNEECTLEFLVVDYNRHMRHHLKQILPENAL
jgi:hypothetical protein